MERSSETNADNCLIKENKPWNNNNNLIHCFEQEKHKKWNCESCNEMQEEKTPEEHGDYAAACDLFLPAETEYNSLAAAAALSPGHTQSNRTSTENLSYSDYADDLLLLDVGADDDDLDVSLNSDDCVYAYRGDGADFDMDLNMEGRRGCLGHRGSLTGDEAAPDDETDFLEMDFDPLSEWEFDAAGNMESTPTQFKEPYYSNSQIMQSSLHVASEGGQSRQLFSSPIDDLPASKALQSQSGLCKNFGRITCAHLDQINPTDEVDLSSNTFVGNTAALNLAILSQEQGVATTLPNAHSLPNTLHAGFGRSADEHTVTTKISVCNETKKSPSKITGAKPKRITTFSTSSSTSSKNSSKSRNSLRSSFTPARTSISLDERSVSCTEFRSEDCHPSLHHTPHNNSTKNSALNSCLDYNIHNDETTSCLDCLEREFLASTIGKVIEHYTCTKCRKRLGNSSASISLYARAEQERCRSGSPSRFYHKVSDREVIFENNPLRRGDFFGLSNKQDYWREEGNTIATLHEKEQLQINLPLREEFQQTGCTSASADTTETTLDFKTTLTLKGKKQRRVTCSDLDEEQVQLFKNLKLTEQEIATISTQHITEDILVQALDKLQIAYNLEIIQSHFKAHDTYSSSSSSLSNQYLTSDKPKRNLKQFILHESKKYCNHPKLKLLIEEATNQTVEVQFKKHTNCLDIELIPLKVMDILHHWTHCKNLQLLQQLDYRFVEANVLGKIANIIRQTQQRSSLRRLLPEIILIPQYYDRGELVLTKRIVKEI